jgi:hypothetical protein
MVFSEKVLSFYKSLMLDQKLPAKVQVMNPYRDAATFKVCQQFYQKFYNDSNPRTLILGINPGRLGGGVTGVPFTDPEKLEHYCGISKNFTKKSELSADFIYRMIEAYGGVAKFYSNFFIGAVCPLGFTKDGKNLNYYDQAALQEAVYPFIMETLTKQLNFGVSKKVCYCLGESQNYKFLNTLNEKHQFFQKIIPLPHPRFIMQYRRKKLNDFIDLYLQKFNQPI